MTERPNGQLMRGHVKQLRLDGPYGFIAVANGVDAYFAPHNLPPDLPFDESLRGREVLAYVSEVDGGKYRARGIRPAW